MHALGQLLGQGLGVGEARPRLDLAVDRTGELVCVHDLADDLDAAHQRVAVRLRVEVARVDDRRLVGIRGAQAHLAAALGVDQRGLHRDRRAQIDHRPPWRVLVGRGIRPGQAVDLEVGAALAGVGLHEAENLEHALAEPRAAGGVLLHHAPEEVARGAAVAGLRGEEHQRHEEVVVQVLPHRQVGGDVDVQGLQVLGGADAGGHQDLRRADDARRQDHLGAGVDHLRRAVLADLDAGGLAVVDDHPAHVGADLDVEVVTLGEHRMDVRLGGARAHAVLQVHLAQAEAFLLRAVVVVGLGDATDRSGDLAKDRRRRADIVLQGNLHRAGVAPVVGGGSGEGLHALEVGQHVVVAPAIAALRRPRVEVGPVAAHEDHAVDRAGATEDLAPGVRDLAFEGSRVGLGVVAPVELLLDLRDGVDQRDHPGLLAEGRPVRAPGLQQEDSAARIFGEATGDDAARRAASHHDVIVIRHQCSWPLPRKVKHVLLPKSNHTIGAWRGQAALARLPPLA